MPLPSTHVLFSEVHDAVNLDKALRKRGYCLLVDTDGVLTLICPGQTPPIELQEKIHELSRPLRWLLRARALLVREHPEL